MPPEVVAFSLHDMIQLVFKTKKARGGWCVTGRSTQAGAEHNLIKNGMLNSTLPITK